MVEFVKFLFIYLHFSFSLFRIFQTPKTSILTGEGLNQRLPLKGTILSRSEHTLSTGHGIGVLV